MDVWEIIVWIGTLRVVFMCCKWAYFNYWCRINLDTYKYGWIAITGASDGIGKAISCALAKRGFKIILISRNKQKLESLVSELSLSNSKIKYVVADFLYSHRNPEEFYTHLVSQLAEYEISGLINNVGIGDGALLAEHNLEKIEAMLGINIYPQTLLTYYIMPKFIQRFEKDKRKSLLINFSSMIDKFTFPSSSVYCATKRYNHYLSEGIRYEYSYAVDVATVKPGVVETNMTNLSQGNGLCVLPMTAEVNSYANYLIKNLHKGINYGHWKHSLIDFIIFIIPSQIVDSAAKAFVPWAVDRGIIKY